MKKVRRTRYHKHNLKNKPKDRHTLFQPDIIWDAFLIFSGMYKCQKNSMRLENSCEDFRDHIQGTFYMDITLPKEQHIEIIRGEDKRRSMLTRVHAESTAIMINPSLTSNDPKNVREREKLKIAEGVALALAQEYTDYYISAVTQELKKHARCQSARIQKSYLSSSKRISKQISKKMDTQS